MSDEIPIGRGNPMGEYGGDQATSCPTAPKWYSAEEMLHYLQRQKYSDEIADELSVKYAENLQRAFNKGFELGLRVVRQRTLGPLRKM